MLMANKYGDIRFKWLAERGFNVLADKHQYAYIQSLWSPTEVVQSVFCDSPSGTGKSSIATLAGVYEVNKGTYDKIIYVRNAIPIRDQGFLPGSVQEKEFSYMTPLIDSMDYAQPGLFHEWYAEGGQSEKEQKVFPMTSSYVRGTTFNNAFVIIDEAQSWDLEELQAVFTRCADTCKIVAIGSTRQIDNKQLRRYGGLTPFELYMKHFEGRKSTYHKLVTNYRGEFSQHADDIMETVDEVRHK